MPKNYPWDNQPTTQLNTSPAKYPWDSVPTNDKPTPQPVPAANNKVVNNQRLLVERRLEEFTPKTQPKSLIGAGKAGLVKVPAPQSKTMIPVGKAGIIKTQARDFNGIDAALLGAMDTTTLGTMNIRDDEAIKDNKGAFTAGQVAGYIAPGAGLTSAAGKGLAKLGAGKLAQNLGGSMIAGAAIDTGQGLVAGDTGKELAKRVGRGAIIGLAADGALMGLGKIGQSILKKLADKQTLSAAERAAIDGLPDEAKKEITLYIDTYGNVRNKPETPLLLGAPNKLNIPKAKTIKTALQDVEIQPNIPSKGKVYGIVNTNYDKAVQEYNDAIETIQNYYGTNELRVSEYDKIKLELGIDIEQLVKNIEDAKAPNVSDIGTKERLKAVSGLKQLPDLTQSKTVGQKFTTNKPIQSALDARLNKPQLAPGKNIDTPFRLTLAEKAKIDGVKAPVANQKLSGGINSLPIEQKPLISALKPLDDIASKAENIDTARAKINYNPKQKGKFNNLWQRARTQLVDRYAPLEDLEKSVRGKLASAESSLYKQARLYEGTPEKAHLIIENELKPIIKGIEDKGYNYKDLGLYAEAVHAKDVNSKGLVSGFTDAEIDDVIKKLGTPEMEAARKQLMQYSDNRLQTLLKNPITGEDGNIINIDTYNKLKAAWPNYMPLNRNFDDDKVEFVNGLAKSFSNVGTPIDRLSGSKRDIIDPIESMIKNTFRVESAVGRNKVGLQLSQLAKEDVSQQFVKRLSENELVGRKNVVSVIENGERIKYEVSPEVYKVMKGMDENVNSVLIKALQAPASVLRAGATLTPDFSLRNPIRDVFNAYIVSKSGFNPFTDFAAGLASYIKKGELYQDFIKNSGGYGNVVSMDRKLHRKALESMLDKTPTQKIVNIINPKSWVGLMRTISDATESATKIGEFRAAIRKGATPQEAAYRARDLLDFARAGTSTKELNKVVAFLNANVQGKSKFIRAIKEDPKGVTARLFYTMAAPSIGAYALNHYYANDDQKATIKDAPDWLRNSFWLLAIPGTDIVARIPKPFDAAMVSNSVERMLDYTAGKDPNAFDGFIKSTIKEQSIPIMLTGIAPIIEGMTNYSFFRGAPIIPLREQMLQSKDQYDIYTSEVSKAAAAAVRAIAGDETNFGSPRIMENTIRGLTAGLGGYALDAVDAMAGKEKPAKNISQLPVIKAFAVNEYSTGKSMDFIYDEKDNLTKEKNSLKLGKLKFAKEKQLDYLETVVKQIGEISTEIKKIQNSNNLTSVEKRDKINVLSEKRNTIARKAQELYKSKEW
jgi:hypothetical protein